MFEVSFLKSYKTMQQDSRNEPGAGIFGIKSSKSTNVCYALKRNTPPDFYIKEALIPHPNATK